MRCSIFFLITVATPALLSAAEWKPVGERIMTRWAKDVRPDNAWPEYPRPQMVRKEWLNLNGLWDYAVVGEPGEWKRGRVVNAKDDPLIDLKATSPSHWDGEILVPFCIESALSGVGKIVRPNQLLWYRRTFEIPGAWSGKRVLLHFEAVDWHAVVWVNGRKIGEHKGGYDRFSFDVTAALKDGGPQQLVLCVWDPTNMGDQAVGKQSLPEQRRGYRYTPSTGIWQTVWLEPVPTAAIARLKLIPDVDEKRLMAMVDTNGDAGDVAVELTALDAGRAVASASGSPGNPIALNIATPKLWSPDHPFLYDLKAVLKKDGRIIDSVESYFGMRKVSVGVDARGIPRITLNNKPLFQYGPLDQGYWPDGVNLPATDEAAAYDVDYLRRIGCNMDRVHVTVHPDRWYYHCDRLGLLVWQDMVCTRKFQPKIAPESAAQWELEQKRMIDNLHNHPSIIMWVIFNEGWGQYDTERLTAWTKRHDPTRLVDNASGWSDKGVGDVYDLHDYSFHPSVTLPRFNGRRAFVLGEVGGFDVPLRGHLWHPDHPVKLIRDAVSESGREKYTSAGELEENYGPWLAGVRALIPHGLCAAVYTQISDVEHEPNGFLTYDREVSKIDVATLKKWHDRLYDEAPATRAILPASRSTPQLWKYKIGVAPDNWFAADFDDSEWKSGKGPFGTPGEGRPDVATHWRKGPMHLRRTFTLDAIPERAAIRVYAVDPCEIFLNGKRVKGVSNRGRQGDLRVCDAVLRVDLPKVLRKGNNTIAVRCAGKKTAKFVDMGVVELLR